MKVVHASQADGGGGAARAAYRIHRALCRADIDSWMVVADRVTDDPRVRKAESSVADLDRRIGPRVERWVAGRQYSPNPVLHSPAIAGSGAARQLVGDARQIINLHWVTGGFLSVRQIGRLRPPIVWTMHDMWAFCGSEHYAGEDPSARWRTGYRRENLPATHSGLDVDRWTWNRKKRWWRRPFHVVTPSRWLRDCLADSDLLGSWPSTVIPNPIEVDVFHPGDRPVAREDLGLRREQPVILFGALGGRRDPRKGFDLLARSLTEVAQALPGASAVVFGQTEPGGVRLPLPVRWLGHVKEDRTLAGIYRAADVVVVPSLQDNLPQTATEAQACGVPVVAFDRTGLVDAVEHGRTGYLATSYDTHDFAKGIIWAIGEPERQAQLGASARERALRLWSPDVVAAQYREVYGEALEQHPSRSR